MCCEVGGCASGLRGCGRRAGEGRVAVRWRAKVFGGEWVVRSAGVHRAAWGSESAQAVRVAVRGWAKVFGGEWVVRSAGLTHFRRSRSRVRVLLYIRPPCPRREIAAMGPKDAPCEHPSPAKTSAPAPSAFIFPRRRSPSPAYPLASRRMTFAPAAATFALPCPRSHFPRIAFGGPRGAIGIPQQQLSTMGYPRKSYPHRCSLLCAKRSRPRACARVYIIYRSLVGRSRGVSASLWERGRAVVATWPAPPCAGWGRAKAKADAPRAVLNNAACVPNHCVQRRKCTRQSPLLPVRTPRAGLSTAVPLPAYGRSAERRVGEGEGKGGRPLAQQPALSPPTAESLCAMAECTRQSSPLPVRSSRAGLSTAVHFAR